MTEGASSPEQAAHIPNAKSYHPVRNATIVAGAACLLGGVVLYAARQDVIVAGGSDALTAIYRPPFWSQLVALVAFGLTLGTLAQQWHAILHRRQVSLGLRWTVLVAAAVAIFVMSLHTVTISGKDDTVNDVWGIWIVRKLHYGHIDPRSTALLTQRGPFLLRFDDGTGQPLDIFLGIPPWQPNAAAILAHPLLQPPPDPLIIDETGTRVPLLDVAPETPYDRSAN